MGVLLMMNVWVAMTAKNSSTPRYWWVLPVVLGLLTLLV